MKQIGCTNKRIILNNALLVPVGKNASYHLISRFKTISWCVGGVWEIQTSSIQRSTTHHVYCVPEPSRTGWETQHYIRDMDSLQIYILIHKYNSFMNELCSQHSPCPTVELQSLMGEVVCAHTWKNTQIEIRTSAWPLQREPHTLPSLKVKHTHVLSHRSHLPAFTLTVSLSLSVFHYFRLPRPSLRFHGSAERAITSASVWRPGDEALRGCGQTPGHG